MTDHKPPQDVGFRMRLADRLTALRLRIDLGEIIEADAFLRELGRDGGFAADDPRVRAACAAAGLGAFLGGQDPRGGR